MPDRPPPPPMPPSPREPLTMWQRVRAWWSGAELNGHTGARLYGNLCPCNACVGARNQRRRVLGHNLVEGAKPDGERPGKKGSSPSCIYCGRRDCPDPNRRRPFHPLPTEGERAQWRHEREAEEAARRGVIL